MHRYEGGGIFFARLLPVIRHLISIPAGMLRMGFLKFSVLTVVGSALWCWVLAWLGQKVGQQARPGADGGRSRKARAWISSHLIHAVKHESLWIVGAIAAGVRAVFRRHAPDRTKKA